MVQGSDLSQMAKPSIQRGLFMSIVWSGAVLCSIALLFRLKIRCSCFHHLLVDDFVIIFAWVLLLANAILWQLCVDGLYTISHASSGLDPNLVDAANFVARVEYSIRGNGVAIILFYTGVWAVKLSFLLFFRKLGAPLKYYRFFWLVVTIFTIGSWVACIVTLPYTCFAFGSSLTKLLAVCDTPSSLRYFGVILKVDASLDLATEALILLMPTFILWKVKISMRRKLVLGGIFSLVLITMIIAAIRMTNIGGPVNVTTMKQIDNTRMFFWIYVQFCVALLVACLASFRALFTQHQRIPNILRPCRGGTPLPPQDPHHTVPLPRLHSFWSLERSRTPSRGSPDSAIEMHRSDGSWTSGQSATCGAGWMELEGNALTKAPKAHVSEKR